MACDQVNNLLSEITKDPEFSKIPSEKLREQIQQCSSMSKNMSSFMDNALPKESKLLEKINQETGTNEETKRSYGMMSGHSVGQFLKLVAEMVQAKSMIEIGTYTGYGAVSLAETSHCEKVTTLDENETYHNFVNNIIKGTPVAGKIRTVLGKALNSLSLLRKEGEKFDLAFIDADKVAYIEYFKFLLENGMMKKGGVILCDNILWYNDSCKPDPESPGGKALKEFVRFVKEDKRVEQMVFPFRDGVFLIRIL